MSVQATQWAWEQKLETGPKLVLLALADKADDAAACRPTIESLAKMTGSEDDDDSVESCLRTLKRAGLISVRRLGPDAVSIVLKTPSAAPAKTSRVGRAAA